MKFELFKSIAASLSRIMPGKGYEAIETEAELDEKLSSEVPAIDYSSQFTQMEAQAVELRQALDAVNLKLTTLEAKMEAQDGRVGEIAQNIISLAVPTAQPLGETVNGYIAETPKQKVFAEVKGIDTAPNKPKFQLYKN